MIWYVWQNNNGSTSLQLLWRQQIYQQLLLIGSQSKLVLFAATRPWQPSFHAHYTSSSITSLILQQNLTKASLYLAVWSLHIHRQLTEMLSWAFKNYLKPYNSDFRCDNTYDSGFAHWLIFIPNGQIAYCYFMMIKSCQM